MADGRQTTDPHEARVREWTFGLLRFAVTRNPADQAAAVALASELDSYGSGGLTFFQRTSVAVCHAIMVRDRESDRILAQYARRIEEPRLRAAFAAAVELQSTASVAKRELKSGYSRRQIRSRPQR